MTDRTERITAALGAIQTKIAAKDNRISELETLRDSLQTQVTDLATRVSSIRTSIESATLIPSALKKALIKILEGK